MQPIEIAPEVVRNVLSPYTPIETSGAAAHRKSHAGKSRSGGGDDRIRVASARIFWSAHPHSNRVADVWVSTTDQPAEQFTLEYYSPRWSCVVGSCDRGWLRYPEYTPEAVFGQLIAIGFHSRQELINALRQFAKIDTCDWALAMLGRLGGAP